MCCLESTQPNTLKAQHDSECAKHDSIRIFIKAETTDTTHLLPPCRPKGARRREGRTIVQRQRDSLCVRLTSHKTLTLTLLAIVDTSLR